MVNLLFIFCFILLLVILVYFCYWIQFLNIVNFCKLHILHVTYIFKFSNISFNSEGKTIIARAKKRKSIFPNRIPSL